MGALHHTGQDEVGTSTHLRYRPATNRFPHRRTCAPSCLNVLRSPILCAHSNVGGVQVLLGTRMLVIGGWDHRVPSNDLYFLDTSTPPTSCSFVQLDTECTCTACHVPRHVGVVQAICFRRGTRSPMVTRGHPLVQKQVPLFAVSRPYTMGLLVCALRRLYLFGGWNGRSDFDTLHVLVRASSRIRQGVRSLDDPHSPFADM